MRQQIGSSTLVPTIRLREAIPEPTDEFAADQVTDWYEGLSPVDGSVCSSASSKECRAPIPRSHHRMNKHLATPWNN